MSLVNDALRRARVEALRQEATRDGLDYRAVPAHSRRDHRSAIQLVGWVVAAVALGAVVWLVSRSPTPGGRTLESPPSVLGAPRTPVAAEAVEPPETLVEAIEVEASSGRTPTIEADRGMSAGQSAPIPVLEAPAEISPAERSDDGQSLPWSRVSPGPRVSQQAPLSRLQDGATYLRRATSADGSTIELGGIAYSEDRPIAVINGSVVSPGDMIAGFTIVAIEPERVELEADGVCVYLSLH